MIEGWQGWAGNLTGDSDLEAHQVVERFHETFSSISALLFPHSFWLGPTAINSAWIALCVSTQTCETSQEVAVK